MAKLSSCLFAEWAKQKKMSIKALLLGSQKVLEFLGGAWLARPELLGKAATRQATA